MGVHGARLRRVGIGRDIEPAEIDKDISDCLGLYIQEGGTVEIVCRGNTRTVTMPDASFLPVAPERITGGTATVFVIF